MSSCKASIAYITQVFPGLTQTFIYREVMALHERGIEVTVFAKWRPEPYVVSEDAREFLDTTVYLFPLPRLRLISRHLYYLLSRPMRYVGLLFTVLKGKRKRRGLLQVLYNFAEAVYLAREMERRGIQHIHSQYALGTTTIALVISKLLGISFSFSVHTGIYTEQEMLVEKIRQARFVVTCTRYAKEYIEAQCGGTPLEKIKCIYHGIDRDKFTRTNHQTREGHHILAVGQLQERKGLTYLVEACHLLKKAGYQFTCDIVGEGPARSRIERSIADLDMADVVSMQGALTQEALLPFYERATIFVLPCVIAENGDRDGIPNALLEAMMMYVPVVSTTVSGIPELIIDGQAGLLVPPNNAAVLAEAIESLLQDQASRDRLAKNGYQKVVRDFDVRRNISQLIDLFEDVIA